MPYDNVPAYIERMLDALWRSIGVRIVPRRSRRESDPLGLQDMVKRYYNRSVPNGDNSPCAMMRGSAGVDVTVKSAQGWARAFAPVGRWSWTTKTVS